MYDTVRWILLCLIFAGLFGLWFWSRRQAGLRGSLGSTLAAPFKVIQKRWVDQKTGVCLVEADDQTFLLAYTVGGGVSWQPLEKSKPQPELEKKSDRFTTKNIFPDSAGQ